MLKPGALFELLELEVDLYISRRLTSALVYMVSEVFTSEGKGTPRPVIESDVARRQDSTCS